MNDKLIFGLIGIALGIGAGFFLFDREDSKTALHQNMESRAHDSTQASEQHAHSETEIDLTLPIPSVSIEAIKDAKDGYNIHLSLSNYTLTPAKTNSAPVQGEGHAHIFVNGTKISRLYGDWFHVGADKLQEGENVVEVTLNANDHTIWGIKGKHISDTITVVK